MEVLASAEYTLLDGALAPSGSRITLTARSRVPWSRHRHPLPLSLFGEFVPLGGFMLIDTRSRLAVRLQESASLSEVAHIERLSTFPFGDTALEIYALDPHDQCIWYSPPGEEARRVWPHALAEEEKRNA